LGHQSGTQALHGLRLGERQAGRQLLGLGQRLAGTGDLALARRQLRLHEMGLGALRVQHQHLLDHGLRLLQAASLRRVIDLLQGGFGLRHRAQAGAQARTQQHRHGQPPGQTLHQGSIHHGLCLLQGCRYRLEMVPRGQKTSARQGRRVRTAGNNSQFNSNK
jgi:hypothetical protein